MNAITLNQAPPLVQSAEVFTVFSLTITQRHLKIAAVALASLSFFALQWGLSWPISIILSAAVLSFSIASESGENWFNTNFDFSYIKLWTTLLILRPFIIQIVCLALGIPLPPIPQTGIAKAMLSQPWKMIPLATIVAPFTEEMHFRGVLLDFLKSLNLGEELSMWIQAAIFGAIHLKAAVEEGAEFMLFLVLTLAGYCAAHERSEANSLLCPMAVHSANNIGSCIYIFLSERNRA